MAVISGVPSREWDKNPLPPDQIVATRKFVNDLVSSRMACSGPISASPSSLYTLSMSVRHSRTLPLPDLIHPAILPPVGLNFPSTEAARIRGAAWHTHFRRAHSWAFPGLGSARASRPESEWRPTMPWNNSIRRIALALGTFVMALTPGCSTVKMTGTPRSGTEQLLLTGTWDAALMGVDFRPLTGSRVFLDAERVSVVDKDWIISSIRRTMAEQGVLLENTKDKAQVIVEAAFGAYGTDGASASLACRESASSRRSVACR